VFYLQALTCKNTRECGRQIPIPWPMHQRISGAPQPWPKDGKPRNFLCLGCNHVYEYTAPEVHLAPSDDPTALGLPDSGFSVLRISIGCDQGGTPHLLRILVSESGTPLQQGEASERIRESEGRDVTCQDGHTASWQPHQCQPENLGLSFDPDWHSLIES
jgi:hypothetical protein